MPGLFRRRAACRSHLLRRSIIVQCGKELYALPKPLTFNTEGSGGAERFFRTKPATRYLCVPARRYPRGIALRCAESIGALCGRDSRIRAANISARPRAQSKEGESVNWLGIEAAVISFVCIGIFHPIVIKAEYYFSSRCWPVFLAAGALCCAASLFVRPPLVSVALGSLSCTCLWCIIEFKEQERRVASGWFPKNPKRRAKNNAARASRQC